MSVNFHAFQSRGYLFSNSEALCEQWRTEFSGYDPTRIQSVLHLTADTKNLYLSYFHTPYRLRLASGWLEKQQDGLWTDQLFFNETMAVYHLLHYTKDCPLISGIWVPNSALDGVVSRHGRMPDPLLAPFAKKFTGKTSELEIACQKLGGKKLTKGDVSYQFEAFPQIQLQMIFWDADEDFPAQVQVLVDKTVTDFVHFETTGCIISDLLEKLEHTDSTLTL